MLDAGCRISDLIYSFLGACSGIVVFFTQLCDISKQEKKRRMQNEERRTKKGEELEKRETRKEKRRKPHRVGKSLGD